MSSSDSETDTIIITSSATDPSDSVIIEEVNSFGSAVDLLEKKKLEIQEEYDDLVAICQQIHDRLIFIDKILYHTPTEHVDRFNDKIYAKLKKLNQTLAKSQKKADDLEQEYQDFLEILELQVEIRGDDFDTVINNDDHCQRMQLKIKESTQELMEIHEAIKRTEDRFINPESLRAEKEEIDTQKPEIDKVLNRLKKKLFLCDQMILQERWRETYIKYAEDHDINYNDSVYDSSLFDNCNRRHQEQLVSDRSDRCVVVVDDADVIDLSKFTIESKEPLGRPKRVMWF